jgi:hypothetical protein
VSSAGEGGARKLGFLQYVGYGIGDTANNLTSSMVSSFLLLYYTDVAGIPPAAPGPVRSSPTTNRWTGPPTCMTVSIVASMAS